MEDEPKAAALLSLPYTEYYISELYKIKITMFINFSAQGKHQTSCLYSTAIEQLYLHKKTFYWFITISYLQHSIFDYLTKTTHVIHQQDITNTSTISTIFSNEKSFSQMALVSLSFFCYFISSIWYHYGVNPAVTIICTCNSHFWLCKTQ